MLAAYSKLNPRRVPGKIMFNKSPNTGRASYLAAIPYRCTLPGCSKISPGRVLYFSRGIQSKISACQVQNQVWHCSGSYSLSVDVGNKTSHTLQGLTEGPRYYVVIVGYDANRVEGAASTEISGWVLAASAISTSSLTTNSAVVSWQTNKPADSQVEYGTTTAYGSMTTLDSARVASHSQTLTNLQPATTYQFRVRSKDEGGLSVVSPNFTFTTKSPTDTTPPNDVTSFTATPSNGRVSLSWTNPTDADFKGVMLRYRTDGTYPTSKTDDLLAADRTGVAGATDYFDHLNLPDKVHSIVEFEKCQSIVE